MKQSQAKQYTIRNLTTQIDKKLRDKAKETGKSLNEVVLETLKRGAGLTEETATFHDLDPLAGTWKEDPEFDQAITLQDTIDPKIWL